MKMRDFINLAEGLDGSHRVLENTEKKEKKADKDEITLNVSVPTLLTILPDVRDENSFRLALRKLLKGDVKSLTYRERDQVVLAFMSVLKASKADDLRMLRILQRIELKHAGH